MFKKFRNASNYHDVNKEEGIVTGEFNDEPSLTEPNRVLPLKDLIERHRKGQYVPVLDQQFEDNVKTFQSTLPDFSTMSKMELLEFNENLIDKIKQDREYINSEVKRIKGSKANQESSAQSNQATAEDPAIT